MLRWTYLYFSSYRPAAYFSRVYVFVSVCINVLVIMYMHTQFNCQKIALYNSCKSLLSHQQFIKLLTYVYLDSTWKDRAFSFLSILMSLKFYSSATSVSLSFNEFLNLFVYLLVLSYILRYFKIRVTGSFFLIIYL